MEELELVSEMSVSNTYQQNIAWEPVSRSLLVRKIHESRLATRRVVAIRSAREIRGSLTDAFTPAPEYNLCSVEASCGADVAGSRRPCDHGGACTGWRIKIREVSS